MAIHIVSLKCPECGATLDAQEGRREIFCSYCGAKILINNENEHIYRYIDEAAVKRAETERIMRMKQMELEERQRAQDERRRAEEKALAEQAKAKEKTKNRVLIIIGALLMFFGLLLLPSVGPLLFLIGFFLWCMGYSSKKRDNNIRDSQGEVKPKKIKVPSSINDYEKKSYSSIEAVLKGKGFDNITCVPLNDLKVGFLQKPGTVESITINGYSIKSGGKKFPKNAAVVISYHSFTNK